MEILLSILIGISLSATTGFRLFIPLLVLSGCSLAGWVELSPNFAWIGTYPAFAALTIAAVLETGAYFFPYIDNLLGIAATPIKILAGMLIAASVMVELSPMLTWALAIILGGVSALGGTVISNTAHTGSTATTGGFVNPLLSIFESVAAFVLSILSILVPVIAIMVFILLTIIMVRIYKRLRRNRFTGLPS
ncbi:MAG: DUF4126 domain-containing protein [Bacillota bacterium]|nr:DUF4126 domain-containing protein [Bacillota bacterium]